MGSPKVLSANVFWPSSVMSHNLQDRNSRQTFNLTISIVQTFLEITLVSLKKTVLLAIYMCLELPSHYCKSLNITNFEVNYFSCRIITYFCSPNHSFSFKPSIFEIVMSFLSHNKVERVPVHFLVNFESEL